LEQIKSSSSRTADGRTFGVKAVRTGFRHLFIIGRKRNPEDWTSLDALNDSFSLGYISGDDYAVALQTYLVSKGRWPAASDKPQHATVTIDSRKNSGWLNQHLKWISFKDLTRQWWQATVLRQ